MTGKTPAGYPPIAKWLHWTIFYLMVAQFIVGYSMEELDEDEFSEDRLFYLHVGFGSLILCLALVRIWWRRRKQLPPWAPTLTSFERRYAHRVETALYFLLVGIPLSGLGLAVADERRLPFLGRLASADRLSDLEDFFEFAHIGSHLLFFVAFVLHVGLILKHQLIDRDRLLNRML